MKKLIIYQKALQLTVNVYLLIKNNPKLAKDFSLNDQIKRATISVVANIAEGYCRSKRQFIIYLQIASGSANEMVALLQIINLVYKIDTCSLQEDFKYLGRQINSFSSNLKKLS